MRIFRRAQNGVLQEMRAGAPGLSPWLLALLLLGLQGAGAVRRLQGVADAKAVVGRLFSLKIPNDAFESHAGSYEVTEAGETGLPAWLQFDAPSGTFKGVPDQSDCGTLYVCVKAIDGSSNAKDVFSIEISDEAPTSTCDSGKPNTSAAIVVDANLSETKPIHKLRLLESLASYLDLDESVFKLVPMQRDESSLGPDTIRAGPGNALQKTAEGFQIQFIVGCAGEVLPKFESTLTTLESSASNGDLSELVGGLPIVGWHVTSSSHQVVPRERRNVTPFRATPMPKLHITRWPVFTHVFDDCDTTKEAVPEVRIVPTMSTPHLTTTTEHRHRHHHGQDPLRRDHLIMTTTEILASPTYRYQPLPSNHHQFSGRTPVPTPVLLPERPTKVVVVPTRVVYSGVPDESVMTVVHQRPTEDVMSRWYVRTTDVVTVDIKPTRSDAVEPTRHPPQVPNFRPAVNRRLKPLSLLAGKAWRYTIPVDTFVDLENGNTRDLKLMFLTAQRTSLSASSWIQLDPVNQVLYALPLSDNEGKHEFVLEAMDTEGASTHERVELHVWPHPSMPIFTHYFTMTVRYVKWQYPVGIDLQTEVLNRVALLFGDPDNSKLSVISVTLDPVKITWANDSLTVDECPFEEIQQIYESMATEDHHPTKDMKKLMEPEFRIQDIGVRYKSACKGVVTTPPPPINFAPRVQAPLKKINATVGDIIKFKIPEDTFYDFEDGLTRHLALTLLGSDNVHLPRSHWIQFDNRSQEIYGIPSEEDAGRHDMLLTAMDSDGRSVEDAFIIHVHKMSRRKKPPVEFTIHIDYDFDEFDSDTSKKTLVAAKLARLYGDSGPQYIMVTNITRGSVVYGWSNKTLGNDDCPKEKIDHLVRYLVVPNGSLTLGLVQIMEPEFRVTYAHAEPTGVCLSDVPPTFVTLTTTTPAPPPIVVEEEPTQKSSTDDDIYITTIVPAIVIAVMLVIAALVAYFLYWKKRKGKSGYVDKDFIGSGVPVVFANELEEQKPDLGKAPAIMKNEKPPLSSDYLLNPFRRNMAAVRDSAPQTTAKVRVTEPPLRDRRELSSTLYKPPPPFASNREVKGMRPKSTHAYRQATYVPP